MVATLLMVSIFSTIFVRVINEQQQKLKLQAISDPLTGLLNRTSLQETLEQAIAEFCDSEGLRFPLLADEDGTVSKAYGSWMNYFSLRHTYLIDPDGILRERYVKVRPVIHSEEVLARLDELQAAI